jgi:hypothetical protein
MAITTVTTKMSAGVNYTVTTDSSADWAAVANDTYFYDLADELVHYKNSSGDIIEMFSASGGASGIFGIADATGSYTYYATLTLAMASAVSGEVVEMFADVVETGAVTVTLKDGVNINGNGHTYTLDNATSIHALITANSVTTSCDILNLIVVRTGAVGINPFDNCALLFGINALGTNNLSGSTFKNTGGGTGITFNSNNANTVSHAVARATSSAIYSATPFANISHCTGYSTTGNGIFGGHLQNCVGISDSGTGINVSRFADNCTGISTSGIGLYAFGNTSNCVGRSISGDGINLTNSLSVVGCIGTSVSGRGFYQLNQRSFNCTGISSSNKGFYLANGKTYNAISRSTSNSSMLAGITSSEVHNSIIFADWNNALGYGIIGNGGNIARTILNCTFLLSNASAPYLYAGNVAQAISTRGNTYKGGGAFNVNLTQAIVTTEDSQGNIFL